MGTHGRRRQRTQPQPPPPREEQRLGEGASRAATAPEGKTGAERRRRLIKSAHQGRRAPPLQPAPPQQRSAGMLPQIHQRSRPEQTQPQVVVSADPEANNGGMRASIRAGNGVAVYHEASNKGPSRPAQPFVAMHGGKIKAVVDSGRKSNSSHQRPAGSSRRQPSIKELTKMLPWNDPKKSKRRISIVGDPPFVRRNQSGSNTSCGGGGGGGGSGSGVAAAAAGASGGGISNRIGSVRELAKVHQRKKRLSGKRRSPLLRQQRVETQLHTAAEPGSARGHSALNGAEKPSQADTDPRVEQETPPGPPPQEPVDELEQSIKPRSKRELAKPPGLALGALSVNTNLSARRRSSDADEAPPTLEVHPEESADSNPTLALASPDELEETYEFTSTGAFRIQGFQIQETGITQAPHGKLPPVEGGKMGLIKLAVLGKGASGVVHEMLHVPSMSLVAVKSIPCFEQSKRHQMIKELKALYSNLVPISSSRAVASDRPELDDDDAEGRRATGPACPFIVAFHDAFISPREGNVSIVMEYMDGGSLQEVVDAGGCACEEVLANVAESVLRALLFLHNRKQIHRDIKPSNLLINHKGEVKISDFGIVRDVTDDQLQVNTFVGTMIYMSPERINGNAYSFSSDIWSCGLSLMSMALGQFPIATTGGYWGMLQSLNNAPAPRLPAERFSPAFVGFVAECLEKDPEQRPSAARLLEHPFLLGARARNAGAPRTVHDQSTVDAKEKLKEICTKLVELKVHQIELAGGSRVPGDTDYPASASAPLAQGATTVTAHDGAAIGGGGNGGNGGGAASAGGPGAGNISSSHTSTSTNSSSGTDTLSEMGHCTCTAKSSSKCAFCMTTSFGSMHGGASDGGDGHPEAARQHTVQYIPKVDVQACVTLADQIGLSPRFVRARLNQHIARGNEYLRRARLYNC